MIKSIWAYIALGFGVLLTYLKFIKSKNKQLEIEVSAHQETIEHLIKREEVKKEIKKERIIRDKIDKKIHEDNIKTLEQLIDETNDIVVAAELRRLYNENNLQD